MSKTNTAIYLDYAAATPLDNAVLQEMIPYFNDCFYNPSALYGGARMAKQALDGARAKIAQTIGCRPGEVVFTAGGSESTNLAVRGIAEAYPGSTLLYSAIEHEAVRMPAQRYASIECGVDEKGIVRMSDLQMKLDDMTVLISVMYANNEVGSVQPIKDIVALVDATRKDRAKRGVKLPLYVHTDAAQTPTFLDVNVARLGVDLMTLNGGKIYGPKQSGILYVRAGVELQPQILGGGQEAGFRSGTEHVAAAVGFAAALEKAQDVHKQSSKDMRHLSRQFSVELQSRFGASLNGHATKRLPNNVHVTFPGTDNERVLFALDERGVWAAAGSACSASSEEVSHVLSAMGITDRDARSSVRFSFGRFTTEEELRRAVSLLDEALKA